MQQARQKLFAGFQGKRKLRDREAVTRFPLVGIERSKKPVRRKEALSRAASRPPEVAPSRHQAQDQIGI
jgi:hypothetical protein